jgi:hypothetical protein
MVCGFFEVGLECFSVNIYALGMELRFKDGEDSVIIWVFV